MTRVQLAVAMSAAALVFSGAAQAEPSARDRAAAEAIFRQATALMDEERYAEACEKFAASQQLDPGLGTLLYLADCYDRAGRTASAWALFREVEERSRRGSQADRERIAKERAEALEGKLAKLELRVPPHRRSPGLEVRVAGSLIPPGSWNTPLPVDPGTTQIEVTAPGKKSAKLQVKVAPGPSQQLLELPALADAPREKSRSGVGGPARSLAEPESSPQKGIGYVMAGAGLVALGVGGFFAYRAYEKNNTSKAECRADDPNACTRKGFDLRQEAQSSAKLATIAAVSGATLSLGALTVVLLAPTPKREVAAWQVEWRGEW